MCAICINISSRIMVEMGAGRAVSDLCAPSNVGGVSAYVDRAYLHTNHRSASLQPVIFLPAPRLGHTPPHHGRDSNTSTYLCMGCYESQKGDVTSTLRIRNVADTKWDGFTRVTENGTQVPTVFHKITALGPPTEKWRTTSDILILEDSMILMDPWAPCLPDRRIPGLLRA